MATEVEVRLTLSPEQAAGLKRFTEKIAHDDAMGVLYPHVAKDRRSEQAYTILDAFAVLDKALADSGARAWPWVETGRP